LRSSLLRSEQKGSKGALALVLLFLAFPAAAQTARVILRWKASPGVRSYHVQISRESSFSEVVLDEKVTEPLIKWEALPASTFFWRVRSFDLDGRASEWSPARQIAPVTAAPGPQLPAENASLPCTENPLELTLTSSAVIKQYVLELSPDGRFGADAVVLRADNPHFTIPLGPGSYSWRGRGVDLNDRLSDPSAPRKLTIRLAAPRLKPLPDVPAGTAPVSLSWSASPCAKHYLVEAWHESPEHVFLESREPALSFKPSGVGEYHFRVAARDPRGNSSDWSGESTFRVRLPAPGNPTATLGAQTNAGHETLFGWSPSPQAASYLLEVSANETFKDATTWVGPALTARLTLKAGRYQWRVSARDALGHASFPSELGKLMVTDSVLPPEMVTMLFPLSGASLDRPDDGLLGAAWSEVAGAKSYELEVDGVVRAVQRSPTRLELSDADHQLRVRAVGLNGQLSPWSEPTRFFFGRPRTALAKIDFDNEPLRCNGVSQSLVEVRLIDSRGRPVTGMKPTVSVDVGSLSELQEDGARWLARWRSPPQAPEGLLGTLWVSEREFQSRQTLQLTHDFPTFTLGANVGGRFNGGAVSSPAAVLSFGFRAVKGGGRFTAHLRAGFYRAAAVVRSPDGPVSLEVLAPSVSLLPGAQLELGRAWALRLLAGPSMQLTYTRSGSAGYGSVLPSLELAAALCRRLGPGALELELSFLYGRLDNPLAKLQAGGLFAGFGYRLDLPGGY
jgi:hypothetical protein